MNNNTKFTTGKRFIKMILKQLNPAGLKQIEDEICAEYWGYGHTSKAINQKKNRANRKFIKGDLI